VRMLVLGSLPQPNHESDTGAVLWVPSAEPVRWVQGELLKFRPPDFGPDKDDAVPRVRKADGGKCEGGPVGTTYRMS
jgi:hypothetical protein